MKKIVKAGNVEIGGGTVSVQSMTNTDTGDYDATLSQIRALHAAGCDIVRVAVSSEAEAAVFGRLVQAAGVPLVADIQFDYRLAILTSDLGAAKVRFNPGNIGSETRIAELVAACRANGTPIRIGVNAGSLEKDLLEKYGPTAEALAASALRHTRLLEKHGFYDIVLSAKASSVKTTIAAYRLLAGRTDYPLHVGVTEAGAYESGLVKSAIGIGALLADGIGDTIRVSLSGDPLREAAAGHEILRALGLEAHCEIISCPTCSRCKYDLMSVVDEVRALTRDVRKPLKIAVMGCVVNGPGEARDADFGIAGGGDKAVVFVRGERVKTVPFARVKDELKKLIEAY